MDTNTTIGQRLDYIHNNPLDAGFVVDPSAWSWSSCADYEKEVKGKIDLVYL